MHHKPLENFFKENGQQKTDGWGMPSSGLYIHRYMSDKIAGDKHYCVETMLYPATISGLIGEASVKQLRISFNNRGGLTG
ncbi:uncharacterized protein BO96DRAFT_351504 [Aspergillus niger CBS 101883]|uniref:Uncharacterized protein n=2 Tax=Aspergillus niger TaxID=5061 RepID=A2R905_ASPNC|nr:uncharacterized protein BO96DRAFT_351504 [Aspergillus niger CBS 101883]XP_059604934.1 hypothetical protein An16g09000 [Aspergillus niger]PYH50896.1 hypothetical protein BO96DRAFT_351504 [Aspergillus niger CBS 101883]CAK47096.1 hypothetical protein An16g09000 [Aspergillus niger]